MIFDPGNEIITLAYLNFMLPSGILSPSGVISFLVDLFQIKDIPFPNKEISVPTKVNIFSTKEIIDPTKDYLFPRQDSI